LLALRTSSTCNAFFKCSWISKKTNIATADKKQLLLILLFFQQKALTEARYLFNKNIKYKVQLRLLMTVAAV